jgi:peptidoglycan/LPS O-acetylase OafA/YrhL
LSETRFIALDGWRGVCALLVATYHLHLTSHAFGLDFIRGSWLFVDFFFVLSGFVITHADERRLISPAALGAFMMRRLARLWPLHLVVLALFALLQTGLLIGTHAGLKLRVQPFTGGFDPRLLIDNVFFLQVFGRADGATWNVPSWSISTEMFSYALFAALCLAVRYEARVYFAIAIALGAALSLVMFSPEFDVHVGLFALLRCLYGFFVGHVVYRIHCTKPLQKAGYLEIVAVAAVVVFVAYAGPASTDVTMLAPLLFAFVVYVFAAEIGPISPLLKTGPAVLLGQLSYAIYMLHWLVLETLYRGIGVLSRILNIDLIRSDPPGPVTLDNLWLGDFILVLYLASLCSLALLARQFVEIPGQQALRTIPRHRPHS